MTIPNSNVPIGTVLANSPAEYRRNKTGVPEVQTWNVFDGVTTIDVEYESVLGYNAVKRDLIANCGYPPNIQLRKVSMRRSRV